MVVNVQGVAQIMGVHIHETVEEEYIWGYISGKKPLHQILKI